MTAAAYAEDIADRIDTLWLAEAGSTERYSGLDIVDRMNQLLRSMVTLETNANVPTSSVTPEVQ